MKLISETSNSQLLVPAVFAFLFSCKERSNQILKWYENPCVVFMYPVLIYMAFAVKNNAIPKSRMESALKINKSSDSLESFP